MKVLTFLKMGGLNLIGAGWCAAFAVVAFDHGHIGLAWLDAGMAAVQFLFVRIPR